MFSLAPRVGCVVVVLLLALGGTEVWAQVSEQELHTPVYITVRIFQGRAKKGSAQDLSDQVFRLQTANLTSYEKWIGGLKKAYPGLDIALIQTYPVRVYKSPRPAIISFGQKTARHLEMHVSAALSPGDGHKPGLTIIPEVEVHFGNDRIYRPISLAIQPFEAEEGMTYFFTNQTLALDPRTYVAYFRPGARPKPFEDDAIFMVFALSIEPGDPAATARIFDEKQSVSLQASAMKKVQPTLPEEIRQLGGTVQVRVEVGSDGKVAHANVFNSTLPEANQQSVAAAEQWEFSASTFAEDKKPIRGLLTFNFTAPEPTPKNAAPSTPKPKGRARALKLKQ
jgi:TonB family protein